MIFYVCTYCILSQDYLPVGVEWTITWSNPGGMSCGADWHLLVDALTDSISVNNICTSVIKYIYIYIYIYEVHTYIQESANKIQTAMFSSIFMFNLL